jgi:DNA-binding FadR family transcriptional regulator
MPANEANRGEAAEAHRRIYHAIRARDANLAREAMNEHLLMAQAFQAEEPQPG